MRRLVIGLLAVRVQAHWSAAQVLTGTLIGTVKDAQGGVLPAPSSASARQHSSVDLRRRPRMRGGNCVFPPCRPASMDAGH